MEIGPTKVHKFYIDHLCKILYKCVKETFCKGHDTSILEPVEQYMAIMALVFLNGSLSGTFNPFPERQILGSCKLKEFADYNFKFDENGGKLSERVENIVGKGEIACFKQFLLFPQCY